MHSTLIGLGLTSPVLAAPMAGGGSTPALVVAAAKAGGLGFVAAGYQSPAALAGQIGQVRASGVPFGVNVFAPNPVPVDRRRYREYADLLRADADRYGVDVSGVEPIEDDDHWADKIDLLLADPVPVVSFTFGLPAARVVTALRAAGTLVVQTVTSAGEARAAAGLGVDLLVVQACAAGGHSGTFTPDRIPPEIPLPRLLGEVGAAVDLPLIAAGGIATPTAVGTALAAGADAVSVGTVLLRSDESGASAPHRDALADTRRRTVVTRAFTGRPARGLRNEFTDRHSAQAPAGYPALHHLTSPIRKAAVAAGDPERVNLWAGTGYHNAAAEPAARILTGLTRRL
ncbi:NAD(P)H-dependent flavin oxidoreductase [Herbidospora yilanensis]|uniref:NAD(P)H-dependent flavin oxidoreductase n=1 Tax=Herbidospora yilanensis TaxID=354426 RepID=UPI0007802A9A|nr:nitronate monooxygenase [Herbidospora yilanensis]